MDKDQVAFEPTSPLTIHIGMGISDIDIAIGKQECIKKN
jgi:hypothetical protein